MLVTQLSKLFSAQDIHLFHFCLVKNVLQTFASRFRCRLVFLRRALCLLCWRLSFQLVCVLLSCVGSSVSWIYVSLCLVLQPWFTWAHFLGKWQQGRRFERPSLCEMPSTWYRLHFDTDFCSSRHVSTVFSLRALLLRFLTFYDTLYITNFRHLPRHAYLVRTLLVPFLSGIQQFYDMLWYGPLHFTGVIT